MNNRDLQASEAEIVDIVVKMVDGCGFLPIVVADDQEIFRGEYQLNLNDAIERIAANFPTLLSKKIV
jgi:hypothetical protein